MNIKSYILGVISGVFLTLIVLMAIAYSVRDTISKDEIQYLEKPVSYENKKESSFQVFQVLGNAALAHEVSDVELESFLGNTVMILGNDFYDDQVITIKNPLRVGTFKYTNNGGIPKTIPVLNGTME